jgi:hypothetical protein
VPVDVATIAKFSCRVAALSRPRRPSRVKAVQPSPLYSPCSPPPSPLCRTRAPERVRHGHSRHCRPCSSSRWLCHLGPPLSELRSSARARSSRRATAQLPWPRPPPRHSRSRWRCCRPQALVAPPPLSLTGHAVCTGGCTWAHWCRTSTLAVGDRPTVGWPAGVRLPRSADGG